MHGLDFIIESMHHDKGIDYIDAVVQFAEEKGLDVEDVIKELHTSIVGKIKHEFVLKRMVKGETAEDSLSKFL